MFYQEALPRVWFVSCVDSLLTIADRHWRTLDATFEKAESANSLPLAQNGCLFMVSLCVFHVFCTVSKVKGFANLGNSQAQRIEDKD